MIGDDQLRGVLRDAVAGPPAGFVDELVRLVEQLGEPVAGTDAPSDRGAHVVTLADAERGPSAPQPGRWRTPVVLGVAAASLVAVLGIVTFGRSKGPESPSPSVTTLAGPPPTTGDGSATTPGRPVPTTGVSATTVEPSFTTVAGPPTIVPGPPPEGCADEQAVGTARATPESAEVPLVATFRRCDLGFHTFTVDGADVWGSGTSAAGGTELVHLAAGLAAVARFPLAHDPLAVAVDGPTVWMVWDAGQGIHLVGLDAVDGRVRTDVPLRDEPSLADGTGPPVHLAVGRFGLAPTFTNRVADGLWVSLGRTAAVHHLDPDGSHDTVVVAPTVPVDIAPHGSYLAVIGADGTVAELVASDIAPVVLGTVAAPGVAITADGSRLWAAGATELVAFDEGLRTVLGRIPGWAGSLAIDPVVPGRVWAAPFEPDPSQRPGQGAGAIVAFDGLSPVVRTSFPTFSNNGVSQLAFGPTGALYGVRLNGGTLVRLLIDGRRDPGAVAGPLGWPSFGEVQVVGAASPSDVVAFDDRSGGKVCVGVRTGTSPVVDGCSAEDDWTAVQLGDDGSMYVLGRRRSATPIGATTDVGTVTVTLHDDGTGHGVFALRLVGSIDLLSLDGAPAAGRRPCTYREIAVAGGSVQFEGQAATPVVPRSCTATRIELDLVPSAEQPYPGRAELVREDGSWRLGSASQTP